MSMTISGIDNLLQEIEKLPENAEIAGRQVISKNGQQLAEKTQENMRNTYIHVDSKGRQYSTGKTRRTTTPEFSSDGLTVVVAPSTDYFKYVEYGTPKMEAEPTLTPAFQQIREQFIKDVQNMVNDND